ncbi:WYL domain-containing protein [Gordonia sp. TBRC 11910]|uniref:WYL domain-containing protein n=1 Tax=Gordonia asplenii TaxID=2725283 RepID=A0A848L856_9ACTN|nr:WYL domain-containing protein [Gordonia asplenii]NMO05155.1 WYL domain-containing protein [Gordonia asplenii]
MVRKKIERQLNLVICLLESRQFVTADYIRENVVGYADNPNGTLDAFNRMFERDKAELRNMGLPLLTGPAPHAYGAEGYRIDRASYELPDIHLSEDEAAAVAMAALVWDSPDVDGLTRSAIRKLKSAGIDVRTNDEVEIAPRAISSEPVIRALMEACASREAVTFLHRAARADAPTRRTLEPWTVRTHRGQWYVIGHDRDRDDRRTFRVSRITDVATVDRPGAFTVPADLDFGAILAETVTNVSGADPDVVASVWVARGRADGLRRMARSSTPQDFAGEPGDLLSIPSQSGLQRAILGVGPDAVVLGPDSLRRSVVDALGRLAAGA